MPKILYPSQQFALQQKIARKSIREFQPKIKEALQSDFDKAAQMVEALGVQQAANNRAGFFTGDKINNILRTLYESTGGYTAMRYQQMFETNKKAEEIDLDPLNILDEWLVFMLSYWTAISGPKMFGIENTTENEIARILASVIKYGQENGLSQNEVNKLAIQTLREGKINNARSLLIARTESHQALSTGAIGAVTRAGVPVLKQWIAAEYAPKSGKARLWHKDLDRQTNPDSKGVRIPVNQPFLVNTPDYGMIEMQYAHDAAGLAVNNCNCRCCTVYIA
jgi:hypothetical protein